MKTTIVPAQVTTVEDRIMGSLSLSQLMLLIAPVFFGCALYVLAPPFLSGSLWKYVAVGLAALCCSLLAIRLRGKILAYWLVIILRYNLRPRYYLFNKNTAALRDRYDGAVPETESAPQRPDMKAAPDFRLEFHEVARIMATLDHPATNLRFETTKRGGLHVRLTEIED